MGASVDRVQEREQTELVLAVHRRDIVGVSEANPAGSFR
jgi:hypothetical protein